MRSKKLLYLLALAVMFITCNDSASDQMTVGQGGSMTRFAVNGNVLYVVDNHNILVYNLNGSAVDQVNEITVSFGLETIFARGQYLYLGANDAMYIYSIANPFAPEFIFRYAHIVSCDPVVVQGNRAYVTLRSGSFCNRGVNALEIIDISDPYNPVLIANYGMNSPHGLGVNGNYLFLCEGENGLKIYDITNEKDIVLLKHLTDFHAYDVIVETSQITVTGEDGIFQFAYPDNEEVVSLLSKIPVYRESL